MLKNPTFKIVANGYRNSETFLMNEKKQYASKGTPIKNNKPLICNFSCLVYIKKLVNRMRKI